MHIISLLNHDFPDRRFLEGDSTIRMRILQIQFLALPCFLASFFANTTMNFFEAPHYGSSLKRTVLPMSLTALSFCLYDIYKQVKAYHLVHQSRSLNYTVQQNEVALILQGTHDPEGAFDNPDEDAYLVRRLTEGNYKIIWRYVRTPEDITSSIETVIQNKNRIKVLFIRGHGAHTGVALDSTHDLDKESLEKIAPTLRKIDDRATVIFDSCLIAQSHISGHPFTSFAEIFAKSIPGRTVYAADESFCKNQLKITKLSPLEIEIKTRAYYQGAFDWNATAKFLFDANGKKVFGGRLAQA